MTDAIDSDDPEIEWIDEGEAEINAARATITWSSVRGTELNAPPPADSPHRDIPSLWVIVSGQSSITGLGDRLSNLNKLDWLRFKTLMVVTGIQQRCQIGFKLDSFGGNGSFGWWNDASCWELDSFETISRLINGSNDDLAIPDRNRAKMEWICYPELELELEFLGLDVGAGAWLSGGNSIEWFIWSCFWCRWSEFDGGFIVVMRLPGGLDAGKRFSDRGFGTGKWGQMNGMKWADWNGRIETGGLKWADWNGWIEMGGLK